MEAKKLAILALINTEIGRTEFGVYTYVRYRACKAWRSKNSQNGHYNLILLTFLLDIFYYQMKLTII